MPENRVHPYAGNPLDRLSEARKDPARVAAWLANPRSRFLPLVAGKVLLRSDADGAKALYLPRMAIEALAGPDAAQPPYVLLGTRDEAAVFAVAIANATPPEGARLASLRDMIGCLPVDDAAILAQARGLLHWQSRQRFCGACGAGCMPICGGTVMECTACHTHHFPRTDPAVIMLVTRGDRALLAHSHRFPTVVTYSALAGFVECGETLEEAVAREVAEEVGVRVGAVRYHSSQPWPFPASIMLGFVAEAVSEAITIDPGELRDARWFTRAELRDPAAHGFELPRADSIARALVDDWIAECDG